MTEQGSGKTGYWSEEECKNGPGAPSEARRRKGPVAVIECLERIPCNPCEASCRVGAIEVGADITTPPRLDEDKCVGCLTCAIICPEQAITITKVANGRINVFSTKRLVVVAGELPIGESSSGLLVDMVKETARREAEQTGAEILLIDGPPGIGCPVIAAVRGANYAVAVTEPTPAALHDLDRVIQVIRHFHVPVGIVINRAGLHDASKNAIYRYAEENNHSILAEIPKDRMVTQAIVDGRPVVAAYPNAPSAKAISRLAERVREEIML